MVVPYPYSHPIHHSDCGVVPLIPQPKATQKTLINKNGFLSLAAPLQPPPIPRFPPRPLRRSPLAKSVRNIANIPTFTTTDRSLASFDRFPPEIRLKIYGYLLISEFPIRYSICPIKKILLHREDDDWEPKSDNGFTSNRRYWIRHGLFPAILECSQLINREGSQVLYGRNVFRIEEFHSRGTINSWTLARASIDNITRLNWSQEENTSSGFDDKTMMLLDMFPCLKEVQIWGFWFAIAEWKEFLAGVSKGLTRIKKFTVGVLMSEYINEDILRQNLSMDVSLQGLTSLRPWPFEPLLKAYTLEFKGCFETLFPGRQVRWEGEKYMSPVYDDWGAGYYLEEQLKFQAVVT